MSHSAKLRPEDVPKRRPMDVPKWSFMQRQGTSPADVLRTCSTDVLWKLKYDDLRTSP